MNIYKVNECDWVCANSEDEAKKIIIQFTGCLEEDCDVEIITKHELDTYMFYGEDIDIKRTKFLFINGNKIGRTFREELARRTKPEFFASTEY